MDIFPYLKADGYCNGNDNDLKKYYVLQVPVTLFESNYNYLCGDTAGIHFLEGRTETMASVVRSKRANAADQIQMSLIKLDGEAFVAFRKALHTGDYLVLLKVKNRMVYHVLGIKAGSASDDLQKLNNRFFKLPTNTIVNVENDFSDHEKVIHTKDRRDNYTIEELASILKEMYNNAKSSGQVAAIHMFGFKYGDVIIRNSFSLKSLITLAGIRDSYFAELNKGINIFKSVNNDEYGVFFVSENGALSSCEKTFSSCWGGLIADVEADGNQLVIELARTQHTLVWDGIRFCDTAYAAPAKSAFQPPIQHGR